MKKFLALALCALMTFSAAVAINAADEKNVYANDFEAVPAGAVGKLDGSSVNCVKKEGVIEAVKFDGDMALRVHHKDTGNSHDPYVNFVESSKGIKTAYGVADQFVIDYDVYFENSSEEMKFQVACARIASDSGNKFQHTAIISGADLAFTVTGDEAPAMNLKVKTWYTISAAFDMTKKVFSIYVDGVCLGKDVAFSADAAAATGEANLIRTAYQGFKTGDTVCYLDNVKVYNATQPRVVKQATPAAPAVPETKAPISGGSAAAPTADIAVVLAAVSAVAASGAIVFKKKR